ncbi:hypothetical protein HDU80_002840, partial [Chytriomyces hyalinus]
VDNASCSLPGTKTGSLPAALITLKEGYKKAIAVCHLVGSKLNVFGKTARSVDSFYPEEVASESPICLRELTEEETVAWNAVMALCKSLDSTAISRLSHDQAAIFEHVEPEVLNDIDHCIRFLMGQSDKQFESALQWFRVPPPPAELQQLTAQGFETYATEATKRGQVLPPNLIATYLKRLLRKVNAGVITPSMQAAITKMKPSEANATTIVQLLKLNGGRHHIVQVMARLANRILQVDAALSTELAVVMPLTNVGVSDAYAQLMAAKALQVQACGDAERDARDAAVMKEMTEGLMKWNEILGVSSFQSALSSESKHPLSQLDYSSEPVEGPRQSAANKTGKGPGKKPKKEPMDAFTYWTYLGMIFLLVLVGGMFAGLTIGLMSIDETNLKILKVSGTPTEKMYAERIEPIRKNGHLLLVSLLLGNTIVNETLPILFSGVGLEGHQAVLFSTALILVFGE